jgi:hypothetical protein
MDESGNGKSTGAPKAGALSVKVDAGEIDTCPELAPSRAHARDARRDLAARISRLTPDIMTSIEAGNFPSTAAQAAGVPPRTWANWKTWADQGVPECAELFEKVAVALAVAEQSLVDKLKAPPMDPMGKVDPGWLKATQFLLERVHRERWGERVEVRIKVEDSMRELMDDLQQRMSPEAFDEFVIALADVTAEEQG